jgi:hypothetical protein
MYFKVLNDRRKHHGFQYKEGLNVDTNVFTEDDCENGLHFCTTEQIGRWIGCGQWLAFINIPSDARVCNFKNKSKADKIIIDRIIPLEDWEMWNNYEFCLRMVKMNPLCLEFIKNQTEELCLFAVSKKGEALQFVKEQNERICLAACNQNGLALQFVKEQNERICLVACNQNPSSLIHVKNRTKEFYMKAVRKNGLILGHIRNKSIRKDLDICLAAVSQNGFAIEHVIKQTINICIAAYKQNKQSLCYFDIEFVIHFLTANPPTLQNKSK